ncbi:MAG: nucleoside-diphosphate sugar epimerase/dehydratase [Acidobacteriota bacterium]|nr:polysaccharide biosynthesis protein [Blastocatellia bacterium]MDW8238650.1 nucleoside-diphosphate sugar epimerase/dehydratase [Acidobacteriota bacterium]
MAYRFYSRTTQVTIDSVICALAFSLAYLLRFDGWPPARYADQWVTLLPYVVVGSILVYGVSGIYQFIWRYVSTREMLILAATQAAIGAALMVIRLTFGPTIRVLEIPLGIIALYPCLSFLGTGGVRMLRRLIAEQQAALRQPAAAPEKRVLLVGAGQAGVLAAKELSVRPDVGLRVQGFVDDDRAKLGRVIGGVRVLGTTEDLARLVHQYRVDQVIVTMATVRRRDLRRIVQTCEQIGVPVKIMPALYEILSGRVRVSTFRDVRIEDLLGRDVVQFDCDDQDVRRWFTGKRILITGAGGSIGSELCRQLLQFAPTQLLMLDKDENSLFEIHHELQRLGSATLLTPLITDIRHELRLRRIFERHRPQVIFHAAAHKHVPLMELNPSEAILNNVFGTRLLVDLADEHGVETFVMISTDKAVNPTNVMGASKRLAEMLVQAKAATSPTRFSCVRFGNVLGSRGSVVPLFQKQIAAGGPVTVTHPEVTRYFMTIPEAAHLVIKAGSLGEHGDIFVLDMGEPIRIVDLAKDMIRLSGLKPDEDISIEFIGLRPGEKLFEELLIGAEGVRVTRYEKIFIAPPTRVDVDQMQRVLARLEVAAKQDDPAAIAHVLEAWFNAHDTAASTPGRSLRFLLAHGQGRGD